MVRAVGAPGTCLMRRSRQHQDQAPPSRDPPDALEQGTSLIGGRRMMPEDNAGFGWQPAGQDGGIAASLVGHQP